MNSLEAQGGGCGICTLSMPSAPTRGALAWLLRKRAAPAEPGGGAPARDEDVAVGEVEEEGILEHIGKVAAFLEDREDVSLRVLAVNEMGRSRPARIWSWCSGSTHGGAGKRLITYKLHPVLASLQQALRRETPPHSTHSLQNRSHPEVPFQNPWRPEQRCARAGVAAGPFVADLGGAKHLIRTSTYKSFPRPTTKPT